MTRMTRPDCAVMCNLINTHTHIYIRMDGWMEAGERTYDKNEDGSGDGAETETET